MSLFVAADFAIFANFSFLMSEETRRYEVFRQNMKKAEELNAKEQGSATYGASPLADLTGRVTQRDTLHTRTTWLNRQTVRER